MEHFSQKMNVFHNRLLPVEEAKLAGYSALIAEYDLKVPLPRSLCIIGHKYHRDTVGAWHIFTPRHEPEPSLFGHLKFALKYEGIALDLLKVLFDTLEETVIKDIIINHPTSSYARRIWFLYEWLMQKSLALPDSKGGKLTKVLDDDLQYPGPSRPSKRHRVINNLPGVQEFCPTIFKTKKIENYLSMNLSEKIKDQLKKIHPDILLRAAAFMLLKDSKASYAIEGERPPINRAERWAQAIGQAGKHALSHEEFLRLQKIVISDFRFTHFGYRNEGGFVGEHDRTSGHPIPDHISAKWSDVYSLMDGLIKTEKLLKESDFPPVLMASLLAFGFVFIHPFEDGNGRTHRYLIHHVLAEKKFISKGIVFPVSAVILNRIDEYRNTLEAYSKPRLPYIKWRPTMQGNVEIINDTAYLYRYFDATEQAEFLYSCIQETIDKTLPDEILYLKHYDQMKSFIVNYIEMPDRLVDLLIRFLAQGDGKLSKRARKKEFEALTETEIKTLEEEYKQIFNSD